MIRRIVHVLLLYPERLQRLLRVGRAHVFQNCRGAGGAHHADHCAGDFAAGFRSSGLPSMMIVICPFAFCTPIVLPASLGGWVAPAVASGGIWHERYANRGTRFALRGLRLSLAFQ